MSPNALRFGLVLLAFVVCLLAVALVYLPRLHRRRRGSLEALLAQLAPLDRDHLALITEELQRDRGFQNPGEDTADPLPIWELIGGMEGLLRMEANCAVLIDLASLLQERHPEALVVAEDLRLKAREIQWHLDRLRGAARLGKLEGVFDDYAQRAIASYYGMTQRVLALYAWGDLQAHTQLLQVL